MDFELTLVINDKSQEALVDTLILIAKQVSDGFTSGMDRNEDGNYQYNVSAFDDEVQGETEDKDHFHQNHIDTINNDGDFMEVIEGGGSQ